jgi:hypothetical protein
MEDRGGVVSSSLNLQEVIKSLLVNSANATGEAQSLKTEISVVGLEL